MSVNSESLRLPLIYTAIMVLAAVLGSVLASGAEMDAAFLVMLFVGVLVSPLVLKYHRAVLFLSWNSTLGAFFLVGQSPLWIGMSMLSLLLMLGERAVYREQRLLLVPVLIWPLTVFIGVVLLTMAATGGLGIQWMGSGLLSGGRKYVWILIACLGFFALSGRGIPPDKAPLYYGLFFLGGLTGFVGPLAAWSGGSLSYLQYFFDPVEGVSASDGLFRVKGFSFTGSAMVAWVLARYGFGGVFHEGKFWRMVVLGAGVLMGLLSGYRNCLVTYALVLLLMFFLEGHHRTSRLLVWVGVGLLGAVLMIPLTPHLPTPVQRSLAFLPLPVDPMVRVNAQGTIEWREGLWKALIEDVPEYFWLGKGLTISTVDMEWADTIGRFGADPWYLAYLTGEHHNGFLSVTISFGIWGLLAFFWFLLAGGWVLINQLRSGRPELRTLNTYALASYVAWIILFFSYWGTLYWSLKDVTGLLGLSVAINQGVAAVTATTASEEPDAVTLPDEVPDEVEAPPRAEGERS